MATDKQWFLTKVTGALMGLFIVISTCVGGLNIFFELKRDVIGNTEVIKTHKEDDTKMWDKAFSGITENKDSIHVIELNGAVSEAHYQQIISDIGEIKLILKSFERAE